MSNAPHYGLSAMMVALCVAACERTRAPLPVRGFPTDAIAALAQRESVLTNTPDTARLRSYMLAMTEEPHHTGSPGAKAVAEYALARAPRSRMVPAHHLRHRRVHRFHP